MYICDWSSDVCSSDLPTWAAARSTMPPPTRCNLKTIPNIMRQDFLRSKSAGAARSNSPKIWQPPLTLAKSWRKDPGDKFKRPCPRYTATQTHSGHSPGYLLRGHMQSPLNRMVQGARLLPSTGFKFSHLGYHRTGVLCAFSHKMFLSKIGRAHV